MKNPNPTTGATLNMKKRLNRVVVSVFLILFVILIGRLSVITVADYDFYAKKASNQQLRPSKIPASRGTIYDRNMEIVAQSATVWTVVVSPLDTKEEWREPIATKLSQVLEVDKQMILDKLLKKNKYEIIKKKVEKPIADEIRKFSKDEKIYSVSLIEDTKRYYPNGKFASSVVGFTGIDNQGLYGIELKYDKELSGTPGYTTSAKNGLGQEMPDTNEQRFPPIHGNSLVLTIDETIQFFLEKTMTKAMTEYAPKKGMVGIVMDVNTGAVLAMANMPNFDLNKPYEITNPETLKFLSTVAEDKYNAEQTKARMAMWSNKAISYTYQPGSVFKVVTAAAALEERTSSLKSNFYCPGYVIVDDRRMKCHKNDGHGQLNFTDALVNSCNPAFVKIGADLGPNLFYKYFKGFGLTEKTGIDLTGENQSQFYTDKSLSKVSLASCSFGQSMALTPIQVITAISTAVNGGNLVTPYVVKDIVDEKGNIVKSTAPTIKRQVISLETSKTIRNMMESVVNVKTGSNAYIKGYDIGGKSGTSQKQNPGDAEDARISSYVAVAPIQNPEIAVYIMLDEPQGDNVYGSVVAAPSTAAVMSDVLPYLGFNPRYSENDLVNMEMIVPNLLEKGVLEAQQKITSVGLSRYKVFGKGNEVVKQVPTPGARIPRDGTIMLYTEKAQEEMVAVPNLIGLPPNIAKQRLTLLKLNVLINGSALDDKKSKIVSQVTKEGMSVPVGTVIVLNSLKSDTD